MAGEKPGTLNERAAARAAWEDQRWKFRLAVALAVIAIPPALIGLTVALVGFHRSPGIRAADGWTLWLVVAAVATAAVLGATALGSGLPKKPPRRPRELWTDLTYAPIRAAYFGPKAPWAVAVIPALGTFPVIFTESALLPMDPATGQAGVDTGAMTAGVVLAVAVILLREYTGRRLTLLGVTAWFAWAWFAQDAQKPTAGWVGTVGIVAVVVALAGTVAGRRFTRSRADTRTRA